MTAAVLAVSPARPTLVRAVCVREWREALGNKLLVGMTLLPPVVILVAGIAAVAAAAVNPPSDRDVQALYAAAPAVAGLDPKEAVQGFIATYFLILFMLIPTVVPLTMAIYSVIGEKASRTLEPLLATPVGVGDLPCRNGMSNDGFGIVIVGNWKRGDAVGSTPSSSDGAGSPSSG